MPGVFSHKVGSGYDDVQGVRYHFPSAYLRRVKSLVGDWVIDHDLHDRGRGANAYIAIARVDRIEPDPQRPDHSYAFLIDATAFLRDVPLTRPDGRPYEAMLTRDSGQLTTGPLANAVRELPLADFNAIVAAGMEANVAPEGFSEDAAPFATPQRPDVIATRAWRDSTFRARVLAAYDHRCALTGMRLVNGGGAAEVEAAHIMAVGEGGPDIVANGLALSRTVHWMFDRRLITFNDDLSLVRTRLLEPEGSRFLGNVGELTIPRGLRRADRPAPEFLAHHRQQTEAKVREHLGQSGF